MKLAERKDRKHEMTLKINESLGEREMLKALKIAGQTKAWIKEWVWGFFFFFFRKRKPLSLSVLSLYHTATPWLLGYDTCGRYPQSEGAFHIGKDRHIFSSIIWNLKEQKWKHMHCQLGINQAQWGTSYRSICTKTACISAVPWKQIWL